MEILKAADRRGAERVPAGRAILGSRGASISLKRFPLVAGAIKIGIAVLAVDCAHPFPVRNRQPIPRRRAIVERVNRVALQVEGFGESANHRSKIIERVVKRAARRHLGIAETR